MESGGKKINPTFPPRLGVHPLGVAFWGVLLGVSSGVSSAPPSNGKWGRKDFWGYTPLGASFGVVPLGGPLWGVPLGSLLWQPPLGMKSGGI